MKRAIIFLLSLAQLIFISSVFAQTSQINNGLNYLTSTQNSDGSWGDDTTNAEILPSTVSVIETFQFLDQTGTANYTNAVSWLQSQPLDTTDYLSERIHALTVAGTDSDLLVSYLDELVYAWGGYDDFEVNNLDTAYALQALKTINYQDLDTIEYVLAYILSTQNSDGGWGFYDGDESNVYITAMVLKVLASYQGIYDFQAEINNAVAYLLTRQNADGGFGSSPSTVYCPNDQFMIPRI
jgi:prenyltransferase beta subunit